MRQSDATVEKIYHTATTERMRKETAMDVVGGRGFFRSIRRSVVNSFAILTLDVGLSGSYGASLIFCPIWFLISLVKNAIERPGWGIALARIAIPAMTLCVVLANNAFQLKVAEANAQRVVAACEAYHAAKGEFPRKLDDLVPQYLHSVPVAKYCFGPSCRFAYFSSVQPPLLVWNIHPLYRKIYDFGTRKWTYLD
jgi:hypothetical protein